MDTDQQTERQAPVIWLPVFFVCLSTARLPGCLSFCLSFGSVFLPVFWLPVFLSFRLPVFLPFFWLTVFLPVFWLTVFLPVFSYPILSNKSHFLQAFFTDRQTYTQRDRAVARVTLTRVAGSAHPAVRTAADSRSHAAAAVPAALGTHRCHGNQTAGHNSASAPKGNKPSPRSIRLPGAPQTHVTYHTHTQSGPHKHIT